MSLRIGTSADALALARSNLVANLLRTAHPTRTVDVVEVAGADGEPGSLAAIQGALQRGEADIAAHSFSHLPTRRAEGLGIAAVPERDDPRDALVARTGASFLGLPAGAAVAANAAHRTAQLSGIRTDVDIRPAPGAIEARLRELDDGVFDALVLPLADLRLLGLEERVTQVFGLYDVVPAPAQGAIAVECRVDDTGTRKLLAAIDHAASRQAVIAERAFLAEAESEPGGVPAAAFAEHFGTTLKIHAMLAPVGNVVRGKITGPVDAANGLGRQLARDLFARTGA